MAIVGDKARSVFDRLMTHNPKKFGYHQAYSVEDERFLNYVAEKCESPIEEMLWVALEFTRPDLMCVLPQVQIIWYRDFPNQTPQRYRADFVVGLDWVSLTPGWEYAARDDWWDNAQAYRWLPFFAIECDGRDYHNYHEAIERDKQRDRVFATRGIPVLRFTGSEIHRSAEGCAHQVVDMFAYMLRERLKPGVWQEALVTYGQELVLGKDWQ